MQGSHHDCCGPQNWIYIQFHQPDPLRYRIGWRRYSQSFILNYHSSLKDFSSIGRGKIHWWLIRDTFWGSSWHSVFFKQLGHWFCALPHQWTSRASYRHPEESIPFPIIWNPIVDPISAASHPVVSSLPKNVVAFECFLLIQHRPVFSLWHMKPLFPLHKKTSLCVSLQGTHLSCSIFSCVIGPFPRTWSTSLQRFCCTSSDVVRK